MTGSVDEANRVSGFKYINRGGGGNPKIEKWLSYQEQVTGLLRTSDGRVPEWVHYSFNGDAVVIDGVASRVGEPPHDVWLDAKDRSAWVAFRKATDQVLQRRVDTDLAEAQRQINALPEGTTLEWHYSDPYHAAFIKREFADAGIDEDVLRTVYTPRG